jgi:N-acetylmuramoyl-L-alanine amidase
MNITTDSSPNFSSKTRLKKSIKFIIIHYTGMQSEIASIKRLKNSKSKVSCHYLINRKGLIFQMVKDNKVAWHAGKSKWKTFENLNENSIGIELVNNGHKFGFQNYSNAQIANLINLCKNLKKKYKIKKENFLGHSDIAPLRKLDPGEKFPWEKLSKHNLGCWCSKNKKKLKLIEKKMIENLFFKNLYKIGYRYFKLNKRVKSNRLVIKAFQQHYMPQNITGKIDQKTFKISHFLVNELKLA